MIKMHVLIQCVKYFYLESISSSSILVLFSWCVRACMCVTGSMCKPRHRLEYSGLCQGVGGWDWSCVEFAKALFII